MTRIPLKGIRSHSHAISVPKDKTKVLNVKLSPKLEIRAKSGLCIYRVYRLKLRTQGTNKRVI